MPTTSELRTLWKDFECREGDMVVIPFGPDRIRVAPPTAEAWAALAAVLAQHEYDLRTADTDSYNCRNIKGTSKKSLHSFGIALDVNWKTNPFKKHAGKREVRFSAKPTQDERANDVRLGKADTDMTPEVVEEALSIETTTGKVVFGWGGHYSSVKDAMHFEIIVGPGDLEAGLNAATVVPIPAIPEPPAIASIDPPPPPERPLGETYTVIARSGLHLRAGPGREFESLRVMRSATRLWLVDKAKEWTLVDLQGDGLADGFAHSAFLRLEGDPPPAREQLATAPEEEAVPRTNVGLSGVRAAHVIPIFPFTPEENIESNLPYVIAGLRTYDLADRDMLLMSLATIRAETEGFVPISEGKSQYNTRSSPFDLYDAGTPKGANLGNVKHGDGERFKGRGYVQLTGRYNYKTIGAQLGIDLEASPDRANEPETAGKVLALFLKSREDRVRTALSSRDLRKARRLVNGGSHGFDRFRDAFERGLRSIPT